MAQTIHLVWRWQYQAYRRIFKKEQQGKERADYGKYLIKNIAKETEVIKDSMVLEFLALERKPHVMRKTCRAP